MNLRYRKCIFNTEFKIRRRERHFYKTKRVSHVQIVHQLCRHTYANVVLYIHIMHKKK